VPTRESCGGRKFGKGFWKLSFECDAVADDDEPGELELALAELDHGV
jgi:hypothetical protein